MKSHKEIRQSERRCQAVVGQMKARSCGKKPVKRVMYHGDSEIYGSSAVFVDLCKEHRE